MNIISFAWTTPAILDQRKACTRRDWNREYALRFHEGQLVAGYDRSPRAGGRQIAIIRLTADPHMERLMDAPDSDWEAEGFAYMEEVGALVDGVSPRELWERWRASPQMMYVVRFEITQIFKAIVNGDAVPRKER